MSAMNGAPTASGQLLRERVLTAKAAPPGSLAASPVAASTKAEPGIAQDGGAAPGTDPG
jgi:hypothetical protein